MQTGYKQALLPTDADADDAIKLKEHYKTAGANNIREAYDTARGLFGADQVSPGARRVSLDGPLASPGTPPGRDRVARIEVVSC